MGSKRHTRLFKNGIALNFYLGNSSFNLKDPKKGWNPYTGGAHEMLQVVQNGQMLLSLCIPS